MKIHALALGTGDRVERLDEMQFPLEQRVRCTGRWMKAGRYTDPALPPGEFIQSQESIREQGNEPCPQCTKRVREDHDLALQMGYAALNAAEDHARKRETARVQPDPGREPKK